MTDDWYIEKLRAATKIRKLLAFAAGNGNANETASAMRAANAIADQYGIDISTLKPVIVSHGPMTDSEKLARSRGMFDMMATMIKKNFPGEDTEDYTKGRKK